MSAIAARKARLAAAATASPSQETSPPANEVITTAGPSTRKRQPAKKPTRPTAAKKPKQERLGEESTRRGKRSSRYFAQVAPADDANSAGEDGDAAIDGAQSSPRSSLSSASSSSSESESDSESASQDASASSSDEQTAADAASPAVLPKRQVQRQDSWTARRTDETSGMRRGKNIVVSTSQTGHTIEIGLDDAGQRLCFYGIVSLTVLTGHIEVNACTLRPSDGPQRIYASQVDPLPVVRARATPPTHSPHSSSRKSQLDASQFAAVITMTTVANTGLGHLPHVCPLAGHDPFGSTSASRTPGSMRRWGQGTRDSNRQVHLPWFHTVDPNSTAHRIFQAPSSWTEALAGVTAAATPSTVALMRGPKGVGKSTFARSLLNVLLRSEPQQRRSVAFLDLDLGQAEFNIPGTVSLYIIDDSRSRSDEVSTQSSAPSLLSPNWLTHTALSQRTSIYLGQTTPKDIPAAYLSAIESLITKWRATIEVQQDRQSRKSRLDTHSHAAQSHSHTRHHLVVNTMGWTKGLGSELNTRIEAMLRPDHIYDFHSPPFGFVHNGPHESYPLPAPTTTAPYRDTYGHVVHPGARLVPLHAYAPRSSSSSDQHHHHTLAAASTQQAQLPAADARSLSLMAALHSASSQRWNFRTPLIEQRPFIVDITKADLAFEWTPRRARSGGEGQEDTAMVHRALMSLNGQLVALCKRTRTRTQTPTRTWAEFIFDTTSTGATATAITTAEHAEFLAPAIIRYIDMENKQLHLVIPGASEVLAAAAASEQLVLVAANTSSIPPTLHLPVWASLDHQCVQRAMRGWQASGEGQGEGQGVDALAGVPLDQVALLDFPQDLHQQQQQQQQQQQSAGDDHSLGSAPTTTVIGAQRRRVRRNLMRKNQGGR